MTNASTPTPSQGVPSNAEYTPAHLKPVGTPQDYVEPKVSNKRVKSHPGLGITSFVFSLVVVALAIIQWLVLKSIGLGTIFSFLNFEELLVEGWEGMAGNLGESMDVALARVMEVLVLYISLVAVQWLVAVIGTIFAIIAIVKNSSFALAVTSIAVGITGIALAGILSGLLGLV